RRHIIQLGTTGVCVIYDELEGTEPVTWSYLLHTTSQPMEVNTLAPDAVVVTGHNNIGGTSVAHLFASEKMQTAVVDTFFSAPTNWKNVTNAKGQSVKYANHWHFNATTPKAQTARFLSIIDTHGNDRQGWEVTREGNTLQVAGWTIECNLGATGPAMIRVTNKAEGASLYYNEAKNGGATLVKDKVEGKSVKQKLVDYLPDFEI
ncbi:MAG: heparinase, partial [Bacteroides sp.]